MVYKEGTPLEEIIKDGWARGFYQTQTLQEARDMGYNITEEYVVEEWAKLEEEYWRNVK